MTRTYSEQYLWFDLWAVDGWSQVIWPFCDRHTSYRMSWCATCSASTVTSVSGPAVMGHTAQNFHDVIIWVEVPQESEWLGSHSHYKMFSSLLQCFFWKCVGKANSLTCKWCRSSATWVSCGRSCNWPHLGRHSGAFSWYPQFWHQSLQFLAERRTFAFSSACPWAP